MVEQIGEGGTTKYGESMNGTDTSKAAEVESQEVPTSTVGEDNFEEEDSSVLFLRNRSTERLVKKGVIENESKGRSDKNILCSQKITQ